MSAIDRFCTWVVTPTDRFPSHFQDACAYFAKLFERVTNRELVCKLQERVQVLRTCADEQNRVVRRVEFLLSQAPLQHAPTDYNRASCAVTKYAYVHPMTWQKFTGDYSATPQVKRISMSPTKWVLTFLMPEGTVIYSPNAMPGL